ncbi:hypothetical protein GIB67_022750 [Kingdonia uniflora]|uniref:Uncharacterized protein n=1 Tax=Kingdonia uniflora TaxID=39325 RepID=A0A7J7NEB1_9MAGN|nr:hypothetical protein GIB67_022750 [Kingdonia uniflora]
MSMLVVEIFDRHLGDMKFQFGETIIQMKPIHVSLILGLRVSPIANEFLFVGHEHMTNFIMRRFPKKKNTYRLKEIVDALKQAKLERHQVQRYQIEAPAIGVPAVGVPTVVVPAIGSSSSATEIRAVLVRVCSQLVEHGKMLLKLDDHGKMLHTHDGKRKKVEPIIKKGNGEWQKKAEEADVPNKKKKVDGPKKEALTDEQFDHVPLIQLKALIPKIPKKGLANKVSRKRRVQFPELQNIQLTAKNLLRQVTPREILEVANAFMVDDDVEVEREVNYNAISSEYGGDLLEMEESKNGNEKVDDVAEEEDSE